MSKRKSFSRTGGPLAGFLVSCLSLLAVSLTSCSKAAPPAAPAKVAEKPVVTETKVVPPEVVAVDPQPASEQAAIEPPIEPNRLIVLTPRGPLVVHLQIFIGEEPQAQVAERFLNDAIKAAAGEASDVTWEALAANPRFASGLLGNRTLPVEAAARERVLREMDVNRNKRVDRDELALFLAQDNVQGHAFGVAAVRGGGGAMEDSPWSIMALLDDDGDGRLSAAERSAAGARLSSRDADDDEVVVQGDFRPPETGRAAMSGADSDAPARAFELQPRTLESIYFALWDMYVTGRRLDADSLALVPGLLAHLDADGSRDVDRRELAGLVDARPDLVVKVVFPPVGSRVAPSLQLEKMSDDLVTAKARAETAPGRLTIELPDYYLDLFAVGHVAGSERVAAATALFARLDADKNEALDATEAKELGSAAGLAFEAIDKDADGKASIEELRKAVEGNVYRDVQAYVRAGEAGDPLFGWLDADSDGRLTRREMDEADGRLASLDADGDGHTTAAEVPGRLACAIGQGAAPQDLRAPSTRPRRGARRMPMRRAG